MCLEKVTHKNLNLEGYGYKVFRRPYVPGGGLEFLYQGNHKNLPVGKWVNEKKFRNPSLYGIYTHSIQALDGTRYPKGWHIFASKQGAKRYMNGGRIVKKVEYRKGQTVGYEERFKVIVARFIKIIEG
ncbi:hypothetical protein A2Z67_00110 [Candidatus Woesebacteria bacterium RBG_13_36_22]|uniref:Uncharacterized protein n=1 Tax=Candidatus Woesebacteria bacterium RBG_13_36_22 TaxID=1802478 RepID=A0A1F7X6C7_9BACT|nr:MAG: hypothetical protein A2Z67_00110 [Candidatus Woesebacteria bacterium RBG_13_36_22]